MMNPISILFPLLAMVALTFMVWVRLYIDRISELRNNRISAQEISTSRQIAERLKNTNAADNFKNLFEMPVLFYVFCLTIFVTQSVTSVFVGCAWLYVLLRAAHSAIHCTYNKVLHRFAVYAVSSLLLFMLWFMNGVSILT